MGTPAKDNPATSQDGRQPERRPGDGNSGGEASLAAPAGGTQLGEALDTSAGMGGTAATVDAQVKAALATDRLAAQDGRQPKCHPADGYSGEEAALSQSMVGGKAMREPHVTIGTVFEKVSTLEEKIAGKGEAKKTASPQASQALEPSGV